MAKQVTNKWDGLCLVQFHGEGGAVREWSFGCHVTRDTEDTIRAHFAKWFPQFEFLGCKMICVSDGSVIFDTRQRDIPNP